MARPRKFRKVCHFPKTLTFTPSGEKVRKDPVILTIDEYETLRLIDKEGKSQEECSVSMKVARTTIQSIYTMARKKVADALVDGRPIEISGGDYDLCNGQVEYCQRKDCFKKQLHQKYEKRNKEYFRFVIPRREGRLAESLEKTEEFMLLDFLQGKEEKIQYVRSEEKKEASFSDFMHILEADFVFCNEIEAAVIEGLEEMEISYYSCTASDEEAQKMIQTILESQKTSSV